LTVFDLSVEVMWL